MPRKQVTATSEAEYRETDRFLVPDFQAWDRALVRYSDSIHSWKRRAARGPDPIEFGAFRRYFQRPAPPAIRYWEVPGRQRFSKGDRLHEAEQRWKAGPIKTGLAENSINEWDFSAGSGQQSNAKKHYRKTELQDLLVYELARESITIRRFVATLRAAKESAVKARAVAMKAYQAASSIRTEPELNDDVEEHFWKWVIDRSARDIIARRAVEAHRDWNVAHFFLLRALRMSDRYSLVFNDDFPVRTWRDIPSERRPTTQNIGMKHGAAEIVREEHSYSNLRRQIFPHAKGILDGYDTFILTIDTRAGRKRIEESVMKSLRATLQDIKAERHAGMTKVKDALNALKALRLMRLEDEPWKKAGRNGFASYPQYFDRKTWREGAKRVVEHMHDLFRLPGDEEPLTWLLVK
ncbi:MAG: hypothetical protein ABJC09_17885 [Terriglobia bacterium]